MRILKSKT
uniref:Uncharacterized protein n=1 Tax=Acrobeloides nanus TaxID=290746 RepID=A0A914DPT3_9BILA